MARPSSAPPERSESDLSAADARSRETTEQPKHASRSWWRKLFALFVPPKRQRNRPTVSGWLLILIAIGIGIAAYNTASNILFLVLSFVFALLIVNGVLSVLNFQRLAWELRLPTDIRAGESVNGTLFLQNEKRLHSTRAVWFVVTVGDASPRRVFLRDRIQPGESTLVSFSFKVEERGEGSIQVEGPESTYPFGFLRKQTGSIARKRFLVWPALDPRHSPLPAPRRTTKAGGAHRRIGAGTDLVQLRDYQRGDPPRRIHWKATARTGRLMVRQLADEGSGAFLLHIDCSETLWKDAEEFERFLSKVSTVAGTLFTHNRLSGYLFNRDELHAVRHLAELNDLNDRLALAERYPGHIGRIAPRGNMVRFRPTAEGAIGMELSE